MRVLFLAAIRISFVAIAGLGFLLFKELKMELKIGKRYKFSAYWSGEKNLSGLLESFDDRWAYLVCKNGDRWQVSKDGIELAKK